MHKDRDICNRSRHQSQWDPSANLLVSHAATSAAQPPKRRTQPTLSSQGSPRGFWAALKIALQMRLEKICGKEMDTLCRPRTMPACARFSSGFSLGPSSRSFSTLPWSHGSSSLDTGAYDPDVFWWVEEAVPGCCRRRRRCKSMRDTSAEIRAKGAHMVTAQQIPTNPTTIDPAGYEYVKNVQNMHIAKSR